MIFYRHIVLLSTIKILKIVQSVCVLCNYDLVQLKMRATVYKNMQVQSSSAGIL